MMKQQKKCCTHERRVDSAQAQQDLEEMSEKDMAQPDKV
jgi:hypothetical protein